MTEEQARRILEQNERFLLDQDDVEDFGVGIDDYGEIRIEVGTPEELADERRRAIQEHLGPDVPVEFKRSGGGKMAY